MLIADKKQFWKGVSMAVSFFIVLAVMFSPIFGGDNAFEAADKLFNSIAKGSSYYIPRIAEDSAKFQGTACEVEITLKSKETAKAGEALLLRAGAEAAAEDAALTVSGDLGKMVKAALEDSEAMFHNKGPEVAAKYGYPEKEVIHAWWSIFKEMGKSLTKQKKFEEAAFLEEVMKKGIEVGYNFYGIEAKKASSRVGVLSFALAFYVLYTLWWGYAILFLFNGLGLEMKASAKKEM